MREIAVSLIVGLGFYLLWVVWRWLKLSGKTRLGSRAAYPGEPGDPAPFLMPGLPSAAGDAPAGHEPPAADASVYLSAEPARQLAPAESDSSSGGLGALLEMQQTRHVVDALRSERASLETEVARLRAEVTELNATPSTESRPSAHASPLYDEAVELARRGIDVQVIAQRCGISVSEAELVRALAATLQSRESKHG